MAVNIWNVKNLAPPLINTYKANSQEIDIRDLSSIFKEAVEFFGNQRHLETETALLSRCIYRMKMKFRSDKGLKEMEKTNRSLLQYLRLNFLSHIETFYETIPTGYELNTYIPTKNMLDFILVRLQGTAKLMCRVAECARSASFYMESKISIGHFWKVAFICFGLLSRIWVLVKNIIKFCCKFYNSAVEYSVKLKNTTTNWLPNNYDLPENLNRWLKVDWLDAKIVDTSLEEIHIFDLTNEAEDNVIFNTELTSSDDDDVEIIHLNNLSKENNLTNQLRGFDDSLVTFETIADRNTIITRLGETADCESQNKKYKRSKSKEQKMFVKSDLTDQVPITKTTTSALSPKKKKKGKILELNEPIANDDGCEKLVSARVNNKGIVDEEHNIDNVKVIQAGKINSDLKRTKRKRKRNVANDVLNYTDCVTETRVSKTGDSNSFSSDNIININSCPASLTLTASQNSDTLNRKSSREVNSSIDVLKGITTIDDIKRFLRKENIARQRSKKKCIFKSLDKLQWNILKKQIAKLIAKAEKNKTKPARNKYLRSAKQMIKENTAH